jgi:hypothetical protein
VLNLMSSWRAPVAATVLALALALLVPVEGGAARSAAVLVAAIACVVAALALMVLTRRGRPGMRHELAATQRGVSLRRSGRSLGQLALHLSPVLLLTAAFPFAATRFIGQSVGGTSLGELLLASSVTVPWLSQAAAMPIYRGIGHLINNAPIERVRETFAGLWVATFAQTLLLVPVFAAVMALVLGWSLTTTAAYVALSVLHILFAQSLVVANVGRMRWAWASAWGAYAVALLAAPTLWFLPAIAGTLTQLYVLRRELGLLRRLQRLDLRDTAADLARGLLLGGVLWADKLVLFLVTDGRFAVQLVFAALMPAVIAYNYYFVRLAPWMDGAIGRVRSTLESRPSRELGAPSREVVSSVVVALSRTGLIGAVLVLAAVCFTLALSPADLGLVAAVASASWAFMMVTVSTYLLDYIGERTWSQLIGGLHLVFVLVAFLTLSGAATYTALFGVELLLLVGALTVTIRHWSVPEYTLFWRHAVSW